jgi:NAD(P)-dependent dehydrogenase (short-subunit alcohol dehydrogenase family)
MDMVIGEGMESGLKDKVAIVTGGGRGIGAATATALARLGARVVVASRTLAEIQGVQQQIESELGAGRALAIQADVSDEKAVKKLFQETKAKMGPVDVLVNNAAMIATGPFLDTEIAVWDQVMSVNLRSAFLCSQEAFRQMQAAGRGGAIVNLASLSGVRGTEKFKGFSTYVVSKFGIVGLTESLAVEGKELGIRVNCVAPGAVDTVMLRKAAPFLKTKTQPADVAKTIVFLCDGQQSGALNGAVIEIFSNA